MIAAYFLAVAYFEGVPVAIAQELPIDILQALVGFLVALPISQALQRRFPQLE
jgi:uncharacterized membrane protein